MEELPSLLSILILQPQDGLILKILLFVLLLIVSALISGSEVAFFSLTKQDIEDLAKQGSSGLIIKGLLQIPQRLLATILIINNFVNIAIVILSTILTHKLITFEDYMIFDMVSSNFLIEIALTTFLILFFGEILPKIYAKNHSIGFAKLMARPLFYSNYIFVFLSKPMQWITGYLSKNLGKKRNVDSNVSMDYLSEALSVLEIQTTDQEQRMLEGIVSFGDTDIKQIMKSRVDIFAVDVQMSFQEVIKCVINNSYSRIPVYKEDIDDVVGILYAKDLLPHIDKTDFDWKSIIREAYFVQESKKLHNLLKKFQTMKIHLAIVVNEYGGTVGLITLEDIIEEIVGDISDEFDQDDLEYTKIDEENYIFEGKTMLKDFYRIIDIEQEEIFEEHKGKAETLAGFILEICGNFPKKGDHITYENYQFGIEVIDQKRIKQIKLTILQSKDDSQDTDNTDEHSDPMVL